MYNENNIFKEGSQIFYVLFNTSVASIFESRCSPAGNVLQFRTFIAKHFLAQNMLGPGRINIS